MSVLVILKEHVAVPGKAGVFRKHRLCTRCHTNYHEHGKPVLLGIQERNNLQTSKYCYTICTQLPISILSPFKPHTFLTLFIQETTLTELVLIYKARHGCWIIKVKNQSLSQRCFPHSAEESDKRQTQQKWAQTVMCLYQGASRPREKNSQTCQWWGRQTGESGNRKRKTLLPDFQAKAPWREKIKTKSIEEKIWQVSEHRLLDLAGEWDQRQKVGIWAYFVGTGKLLQELSRKVIRSRE